MTPQAEQQRYRLTKLAVIAAIAAFLLAFGALLLSLRDAFYILSAILPIIAGFAILRGRVWGAYGYAVFLLLQSTLAPLAVALSSTVPGIVIASQMALGLLLALLFFFAGRSLEQRGAAPGIRWPWIAIALLASVPLFFLHGFINPSASMEATLVPGDRLAVEVLPRPHPAHGDIVVFRYPPDRTQTFVKRVIGIPGDRIRMVSKTVYRNGSALSEPYAVHRFPDANRYRDNVPASVSDLAFLPSARAQQGVREMLEHHVVNGEVVVPSGKYFVLGDNRDNSLDSRYWGLLDQHDLIGKALFIYGSERLPDQNSPATGNSFRRIRWNRFFKLL